jgi:hypothetical protein
LIGLACVEDTRVLREAQQICVSLQQLFGLDVAVVEGVDEVEGDISRNQIEGRQAALQRDPPVFFFSFRFSFRFRRRRLRLGVGQRSFLRALLSNH